MGHKGAVIAQMLVGEWFGVLGILAPVVVLLISLRLVGVKGYKLFRGSLSLLLLIMIGSVGFGHFAGENHEIFGSGWGGAMGIYVAQWFERAIGYYGTRFLFLVFTVAVLYYVFYDHVSRAMNWYRKTAELMAQKRALKLEEEALQRETRLLQIQEQRAEIASQMAQYSQGQGGEYVENQPETKDPDPFLEHTPEDINHQQESAYVNSNPDNQPEVQPEIAPENTWQRNENFHYLEFEDGQLAVVTTFAEDHSPESYLFFDLEAMEDYTLVEVNPKRSIAENTLQESENIEQEILEEENPFELVEREDETSEEESHEGETSENEGEEPAPQEQAYLDATQSEVNTDIKSESSQGVATSEEAKAQDDSADVPATSDTLESDPKGSTEPKMHIHYTQETIVENALPQDDIIIEQAQSEEQFSTAQIDHQPLFDPTRELSGYHKPTLGLLTDHQSNVVVSEEELIENKNRIVSTLETFGIRIDTIEVVVGPTITLYEIIPAPGIRISKIKNLEDDIAMALSALGIRIIAPIPGKGTIGIEVPNKQKNIVSMHSVIRSAKFQNSKAALPIALGKTIQDETFVFDLAKMPHLLVAGATGQGKSVGLNAIITSLIYQKHPSELKFILIDPKKVELTLYAKLENHFLAKIPDADEAIITDNQKVIYTLNSICIEMDDRYQLLKDARVRSIKEYNEKFAHHRLNPEKGHRFLPYFVVVIDEFADLIMTSGREIETPIARIAQLARAVGIHLIIATQRPTTNIITGVIKANFPARIAFRVTSQIDSRTILDQTGANQLVGQGDMLVSTGSEVTRVQCAFVDTPEVENIVDYIAEQVGFDGPLELPDYQPETSEGGSREESSLASGKRDPLFGEVAHYVVANGQCSASTIQRKFSIGFNRAGRIVDQLEASGIVGGAQGSKPRQVLISDPMTVEDILGYN